MTTWLTTREAAAHARVSEDVIRDAAQIGRLSGVKLTPGSQRSEWRFKDSDVDAWLEKGRTGVLPLPRARRRHLKATA